MLGKLYTYEMSGSELRACWHRTLAVSRAKSRSEARAEAVGVGSTALLGAPRVSRAALPPRPHGSGYLTRRENLFRPRLWCFPSRKVFAVIQHFVQCQNLNSPQRQQQRRVHCPTLDDLPPIV